MVYRLPWRVLDRVRVESAARAVAASLPGASVEVTARGDSLRCLFRLPLALARELEPLATDLDRRATSFGAGAAAEPLLVQIDFDRNDEDWPPGSGAFCSFEFGTASPDNGLCSGAASEIAGRLGRELGVQGRPSWEAYAEPSAPDRDRA